jgi:ubiquinone/menaquinone biosynthesis C-methylase UbiE
VAITNNKMEKHLLANDVYSVGYESTTADFFGARRAATHAAFFLPFLRPGMALLDGGCGPGTITLDLAAVVSPALTVGIDKEPSQVDLARSGATARQLANVRFEVSDLHALPFPAGEFDAVFLHGVLEHLRHPVGALREIRRVLKPGGLVGLRDADFGGFLLEPRPAPLDQFAELFVRLMLHNGGDPQAGRHHVGWVREAGFTPVTVSASFDCWTRTPTDTQRNSQFLATLVNNSAFAQQLREAGLASRDLLEMMSQRFLEWGENPNAFAAEAWGEIVARKE